MVNKDEGKAARPWWTKSGLESFYTFHNVCLTLNWNCNFGMTVTLSRTRFKPLETLASKQNIFLEKNLSLKGFKLDLWGERSNVEKVSFSPVWSDGAHLQLWPLMGTAVSRLCSAATSEFSTLCCRSPACKMDTCEQSQRLEAGRERKWRQLCCRRVVPVHPFYTLQYQSFVIIRNTQPLF